MNKKLDHTTKELLMKLIIDYGKAMYNLGEACGYITYINESKQVDITKCELTKYNDNLVPKTWLRALDNVTFLIESL